MRYLWVLVLAMAALCLLSGTSSAASATTGDIEGNVKTEYNSPVVNAEVLLMKSGAIVNTTTTDMNGNFSFKDVEPGTYQVNVQSKAGYFISDIVVHANITSKLNVTIHIEKSAEDNGMMMSYSIILIAGLFFIALIIVGIVIAYNYSKITHDRLMEHETRMKIFEHIQKDPGQHLRKIGADLDLPMGVLTHHIGKLEREEVIKSRIDGKFKRYYPWDAKIENKAWLSELQNNMLQMIKGQPGISTNDLVERVGGSRSNAYYHITELESKGLIRIDKMEKKHKCYLLQDT